ncbi:hypothetical protein [Leeuwenhoekiella parthenopeia]|uniref:STAS/SEC14 domain-containing protein n=1 Tax=Leeuwenhoekiella parthenopeia TaxID=2890320 RepID=A0ABS8GXD4_9FLAO|nr:hypothetical protein [Leeuwenhoekiella parthenopeia]MCC4214569.1 hypothetical protein [Leeuwenhoekiella parthenopeia]
MRVRDTPLIHHVLEEHKLPFGVFYFFDSFIISEIAEGVLFDWEKAFTVINLGIQFYGTETNHLNYISNRINDYSIKPQDWLKFLKMGKTFKLFAAVTYREKSMLNLVIERFFYKDAILSFDSLLEAVNFIREQEELVPLQNFDEL